MWRAAAPSGPFWSTFAPMLSKCSSTPTCLSLACKASISGLQPLLLAKSTAAPW
ncbi:hypothetical protein PF002_g12155 [Phytophthora fragariae]|uniref:Uncharacterized protein n=2 Tax=Phytophthora TaxID=4783 RepID=A0A6A3JFB1_9STRA|nr:hypothetical protein PF003_g17490 [Phytophthora fragariae]KAE8976299.1 hypothetical protein PR002_g25355 [Phytophthora rubi]KAE8977676.1 hypothetical protein PR001_g25061 [Phytophthora rubi]KAE8993876.1 hypothetical protein PF011_g16957 [Phytophthora fragariae]KAE9233205.1 hypothetical protein PF002_g12155 [Phytophthora fragariae]